MRMLALTLTLPPRLDLLTQTLHESTPSDATKSKENLEKTKYAAWFYAENAAKDDGKRNVTRKG